MAEMIKVGIVEDDISVRTLLAEFIDGQPDMTCSVQASSVEEYLDAGEEAHGIDVLLQDINLPGMTGLEAISVVKSRFGNIEIIMFSIYDDSERIFKAFCAGASGYLLKNSRLELIRQGILDVHRGQAVMSPSIARKVVNYFNPKNEASPLTNKEQTVVQLLTDGLSYKMIADRMQISTNTVGAHIRNIYKKLQVHSKAEVIAKKLKGEI